MVRRLGVGVGEAAGSGTAGKAREGAFPAPVLLATAALAAIGAVGGLLAEGSPGAPEPAWPIALAFLALLTAAGFPTLHFQYRDHAGAEDLFEAILVPAMFVLPPLTLVLVVGIAQAVSEGLQRIQPIKACYNVAQWMAAAAAGSVVLTWLRDGASAPTTRDLLALAAAMVATTAVNVVAFIGVLWLASPQPLRTVLTTMRPIVIPIWLIGRGINLAFGILNVAAYASNPLTAALFLVPLGVLHWSGRAYAGVRADRARLAGMQRPPMPWPCR